MEKFWKTELCYFFVFFELIKFIGFRQCFGNINLDTTHLQCIRYWTLHGVQTKVLNSSMSKEIIVFQLCLFVFSQALRSIFFLPTIFTLWNISLAMFEVSNAFTLGCSLPKNTQVSVEKKKVYTVNTEYHLMIYFLNAVIRQKVMHKFWYLKDKKKYWCIFLFAKSCLFPSVKLQWVEHPASLCK